MATAKNMDASSANTKRGAGRRDVTINVRATAPLRDLIDRAAAALGTSRSDFMLESARARAEDLLLDRTLFVADARRHAAFMKILDSPPAPGATLKKLLSQPSPWEG